MTKCKSPDRPRCLSPAGGASGACATPGGGLASRAVLPAVLWAPLGLGCWDWPPQVPALPVTGGFLQGCCHEGQPGATPPNSLCSAPHVPEHTAQGGHRRTRARQTGGPALLHPASRALAQQLPHRRLDRLFPVHSLVWMSELTGAGAVGPMYDPGGRPCELPLMLLIPHQGKAGRRPCSERQW